MAINTSPFVDQFIKNFGVNPEQISKEYERIVEENGDSNEIKTEFILVCFTQLMAQFKRDLPKDAQFFHRITWLYDEFIKELVIQNISADSIIADKKSFIESNSTYPNVSSQIQQTPYKKYNLNTKYGRRKNREQAHRIYNQMSSEEKRDHNAIGVIILIVICILMWLLLGTQGFLKWASH